MEAYTPQKFTPLLGLEGLSDDLLKNHFALYEGYVNNTNVLIEKLVSSAGQGMTPERAELKRRFGWEWNGMRLHELYFGNLTKEPAPLDKESALASQIKRDFGSLELWEKDYREIGSMRGIGWVILSYDRSAQKLFNVWINEHDLGHLSGATPILVMDVFEHAYALDYGIKRADYLEVFMRSLDWGVAEKRFVA